MAEDIIMPPPERAAKTALGTSTVTSYLKANDILKSDVPKGKILDFGAGKGLGAKAIGADTYEPYVKSNPKYNQVNQIKSNSYDKVTSLNVLNTIEPEARKEVVKNIGRVLKSNGVAVISTRGKDVEDAKIKTKAKDGYIIGKGEQARFQKGFTQDELKNYVQKTLGDNYKVESVKGLGKAAIKVKKLNVDPTPTYKSLSIKGANFPGGKITKRFNEGGTTMKKQMEMFEDGGLKDEGGMIDEVSGNDVPSGSTREEVRDDIPAQLSEGEFVFPADVVRYIGLEKLMMMRQEAKQGLKQMEAMGQMGNSDEATMPDDLPFDINDLDMEDEIEYNTGGVVKAANGAYTPNVNKMYGNQKKPYAPASYTTALGPSAGGAPQTKIVRYFNSDTNQTRDIPHIINADGTLGATIYPIPKGFVPQEQAPQEAAKETKTATTKVAPVESTDSGGDDGGMEGDLGGARTNIGGVEYAIQYNFDGTVGLQSIDNYKATGNRNFQIATPAVASAIKTQTLGQLSQLGKGLGLKGTAVAEFAKKMGIATPRYDKVGNLIDKGIVATNALKAIKKGDEKAIFGRDIGMLDQKKGLDSISRRDMERLQEDMEKGGTERFSKEQASALAAKAEKDRRAQEVKEKAERKAYLAELEAQKTAKEKAEQAKNIKDAEIAANKRYQEMLQRQQDDGGSDDGSQDVSDQASVADQQDGMFTAVGGLIPKKKKPKPKKMKRGGLASKK